MIETIIKIQISKITVDERYYSFKWKAYLNGKLYDSGEYDNDYENGDTPKEWQKRLEEGIAVEEVLHILADGIDLE